MVFMILLIPFIAQSHAQHNKQSLGLIEYSILFGLRRVN